MTTRRRRLKTDPAITSTSTTEAAAIWEGPDSAAPRVEMWARSMADAAFELHDIARPGGWSQDAAEDAVSAFEINVETLATLHPDAEDVLVVAGRIAAELRRLLHLPPPDTDSGSRVIARRGREPGRRSTPPADPDSRRGLGPGWQGL
jgi:hypothetical protein